MEDGVINQSSKESVHSLWMNSIEGVRLVDSIGNIVYVNDSFCALVGLSEEELIGKPFCYPYQMSNSNELENFENFSENIKNRKITPYYKTSVTFQNKKASNIEVTNTYIHEKDDKLWLLSVFRLGAEEFNSVDSLDSEKNESKIDSQKSGEDSSKLIKLLEYERKKNKEYENLIKAVIDNTEDVIWMTDNKLRFTFISPSITRLRGYSMEEAMSQTMEQSMSPQAFKLAISIIDKKKNLQTPERNTGVLLESEHPCKDGSFIWAESKVKFLVGENDEILGLLGVSRDISERKKTEKLLRENKNYLSKIINTIGDPLFVKNSEYRCVLANNAFCSMLGAEYSAVVGKYDFELFNPEECKAYNIEDDFVLLTGHESLKEESYVDPQGERHTVLTKKTRYIDENEDKYVVGTIADITELKEVDRLLRQSLETERKLNNMRTDFISMVSHEFRTPLTTILSSMQIVQQYEDLRKEEKEEIYNRVYDSIKKMIVLLEDILILGGTESDKAAFKPLPCDLDILCLDVIKDISLNYNQGNLIKYEIQDNLDQVVADAKLLRQILNNLLSNAVKYSLEGGDIKLKVYAADEFICFDVEDKGIGINVPDQNEIFKPFFRCFDSAGVSGTGLGLAIVKKSVDLHSGSISLKSEPGKGTTFFVKIPHLYEYAKGNK